MKSVTYQNLHYKRLGKLFHENINLHSNTTNILEANPKPAQDTIGWIQGKRSLRLQPVDLRIFSPQFNQFQTKWIKAT